MLTIMEGTDCGCMSASDRISAFISAWWNEKIQMLTSIQNAFCFVCFECIFEELKLKNVSPEQRKRKIKGKLQEISKITLKYLNTAASWLCWIAQPNSKHRAVLENPENIIKQQHEKEEAEKLLRETAEQNQHMCQECSVLKEKFCDLGAQLERTLKTKISIADELAKQQKTQEDLEKKLQSVTSELSELQSQCKTLENEKEDLAALNDGLRTELTNLRCQHTEETSKLMALESMKHQEELDILTAKLVDMEQHLQAEQDKVCELMWEVEILSKESECIPVLKDQLSAPQDRSTPVFSCPCCDFTFNDLQSLENHVENHVEICLIES